MDDSGDVVIDIAKLNGCFFQWKLRSEKYEDDEKLDSIKIARGYSYMHNYSIRLLVELENLRREVLRDEALIERLSHCEGVTEVEKYVIDTCRTVNLDDGHGYEQLNREYNLEMFSVLPRSHCNVSGNQSSIVPSKAKNHGLCVSGGPFESSGALQNMFAKGYVVRVHQPSKIATDSDAFTRYSKMYAWDVNPLPCNKNARSRFSAELLDLADRPEVFDKYSQLCARNVTARVVTNENTSCGGVSVSNWLKRTRYETQPALPLTSEVFSFKGDVNESRTSETDAFEKYSQLCERNVAPRLAATEDTSVGGLSSSSRLKRTCYETKLSLPVVSEPSSFGSSVNEPTISGTFLPVASVRAITSVLSQLKRAPGDVQSILASSEDSSLKRTRASTDIQNISFYKTSFLYLSKHVCNDRKG
ncbi:hypothetical protein Tco_1035133 [Tanacetum coccineum]